MLGIYDCKLEKRSDLIVYILSYVGILCSHPSCFFFNVNSRHIIEETWLNYEEGTSTKSDVAKSILQKIMAEGGKFLKDDGYGWLEMEETASQEKILMAFRSYRKVLKKQAQESS